MPYTTPRAAALTPYTAGEQPADKRYIKLNTNENPYPPSPNVQPAVVSEINSLYLYPDPDSRALREAIAAFENIPGVTAANIFCGNGSDEVLSFIFYAFFGTGGKPVLFPDITYSFYPVYAAFYNIPFNAVPLASDFTITAADYLTGAASGVIFPNPNAPTGVYTKTSDILKIAEYHKQKNNITAIDEAYIAFAGSGSAAAHIRDLDNLIIIRTLSKSHSLAGMRAGYCIAAEEIINTLHAVKDSFNSYPVDRIAQRAAAAAIADTEYYTQTTNRIIRTRDDFIKDLTALGFDVLPSSANFVFCKHRTLPGAYLKQTLKDKGILVRHWGKPRIADYLRITIGKPEDMRTLINILS